MNSSGSILSLFCLVVPALMIAALVYIVNKTKQEEIEAKQELHQLVNTLPDDKRTLFVMQYNAQKKNPTLAVVLALFLGGIGIHKFYLGKTGQGILYLVFSWTFIPGILAFFEAFTLTRTVYHENREIARETAALLGGNPMYALGLGLAPVSPPLSGVTTSPALSPAPSTLSAQAPPGQLPPPASLIARFCPSCGTHNTEGSKFCMKCGTKLG